MDRLFGLFAEVSWAVTAILYFKMLLESTEQESYLVRWGNQVERIPGWFFEAWTLFLKPKAVIERHRATFPRSYLRKWAAAFLVLSVACSSISMVLDR